MADAGRGFGALPHRRARALALPAIASNVAVPLVGLIDTAVVGHFATARDLGAVGLGAAVVSSIFWAFTFVRPGTTALVGRAWGAGQTQEATRHLQRALALAATLGAAWLALQWAVVPLVVRVLASTADAGPLAERYALIRGLSVPAVLLTLAVVGYLIGTHDTRTPLVIAATVGVVNAVLAVWFVAGLGHGAEGSAWATFCAEWAGLGAALVVLRLRLGGAEWRRLLRWDPELRRGWASLMTMNAHLVVRTALLVTAVTLTASLGSRIGTAVLAANAILMQMMNLASYALDGYATAAETMAAREVGRRDVDALHRATGATAIASGAIALGLSAAMWAAGPWLISALTGQAEVAAEATRYWWVAVALPVASVGAYLLDGIFLGTGRSRDMMTWMAVAVLGVYAPLVLGSLLTDRFTNTVLWVAFLAMNVTRALTLAMRYAVVTRRGGWLTPPGSRQGLTVQKDAPNEAP